MSKKRKSKKTTEQKALQDDLIVEAKQEYIPEPKELPQEVKEEVVLDIADASRRFIKDFKEHWLPGILKFAQSKNFSKGTEAECKKVLKDWGATLK